MLINCPKCGFSQPKDQYCASCGVNIENFRPTAPPIWKSILTSPYLHIAVVCVIVLGSIFIIRQQRKAELAQRVELLKGGPTIFEKQTTGPDEVSVASSAPVDGEIPPPPPQQATATIVQAQAQLYERNLPPGAEDLTKKNTVSKDGQLKLTIEYYEVERGALEYLIENSQRTSTFIEFGDYRTGAMPTEKIVWGKTDGLRLLEKIEKTFDKQNLTQQWILGTSEIGMTTLVSLEGLELGKIRGEFEILHNFNANPEVESTPHKNYPATPFELSPSQSWLVNIVLDRTTSFKILKPEGLLQIFNSPQFRSKQTELTILMTFETPTPAQ